MRHDEIGQFHDLPIEVVYLAVVEFHLQKSRFLLLAPEKLALVFREIYL